MKGLTFDHDSANRKLTLCTGLPEPVFGPGDLLVGVDLVAISQSELSYFQEAQSGCIGGWEFVGTVIEPALNGMGPAAGSNIIGILPSGAWAERVAAPANACALLPPTVVPTETIALSGAGLVALSIFRALPRIYGKRVVILGAGSGLGQILSQMALSQGAEVAATVNSQSEARQVAMQGVEEIYVVKETTMQPISMTPEVILEIDHRHAERVAPLGLCETGTYMFIDDAPDIGFRKGFAGKRPDFGVVRFFNASLSKCLKFGQIGSDLALLMRVLRRGALLAPNSEVATVHTLKQLAETIGTNGSNEWPMPPH